MIRLLAEKSKKFEKLQRKFLEKRTHLESIRQTLNAYRISNENFEKKYNKLEKIHQELSLKYETLEKNSAESTNSSFLKYQVLSEQLNKCLMKCSSLELENNLLKNGIDRNVISTKEAKKRQRVKKEEKPAKSEVPEENMALEKVIFIVISISTPL